MSRIVKVEFGVNINNNSPIAISWGNVGNLSYPHDLYLFQEGTRWYGFTVNTYNNTITRLDFTTSFSNTPTGTNLGNIGNLTAPTGVCVVNDNGNWRVFITNANSSSLSLYFRKPDMLNEVMAKRIKGGKKKEIVAGFKA